MEASLGRRPREGARPRYGGRRPTQVLQGHEGTRSDSGRGLSGREGQPLSSGAPRPFQNKSARPSRL
eukprot:6003019-Heterocapsa_arctica.AAC.1